MDENQMEASGSKDDFRPESGLATMMHQPKYKVNGLHKGRILENSVFALLQGG